MIHTFKLQIYLTAVTSLSWPWGVDFQVSPGPRSQGPPAHDLPWEETTDIAQGASPPASEQAPSVQPSVLSPAPPAAEAKAKSRPRRASQFFAGSDGQVRPPWACAMAYGMCCKQQAAGSQQEAATNILGTHSCLTACPVEV